jgi:hypothetical protein
MMEQKLFSETKLDVAITSLNKEITAKAVI